MTEPQKPTKAGRFRRRQVLVSEYAVLRYIERVLGIRLDDIRDKVLPPAEAENVARLGNGEYPIGGTHRVVVRDNVVTTVVANGKQERSSI